jgi:hypothetical protein
MKAKILIVGIGIFFCIKSSYCQEWIRIYEDTVNVLINTAQEHYDKGYVFSGMQYDNSYQAYAWILKTDINGFVKWQKFLGSPQKYCNFFGTDKTAYGGLIEIGMTDKLQPGHTDPLIIKINSCGEREWCKVYKAPNSSCWGQDIKIIPGGGYIALVSDWKSDEQQQIWLFKLDTLGEVIWAQAYATDPAFWSEVPYSLLMTHDSCILITGEAYYPDPTYPGKSIIKIILIKVTLDGDAIFEVPWGTDNGVYSDGRLSVIDAKNNIYTAGRRARTEDPYGDSPCLFKTSSNGDPVFYSDLKSASSLGISTTINWFQDSTFALCSQWKYSDGVDSTGVIKTDTLGNYFNQIVFQNNYAFYASSTTFNNRLLLGGSSYGSGHLYGCAIKLTSDLEYDSVYTTPITYDSLCSHPIVSDTISLSDCQSVVVDIDDPVKNPEKTRLRVYPNPADHTVTLEMPEYLVRQSAGSGITATTYYYRWKSVRLDVFDLHGKLMYSNDIVRETKEINLDISSWPAGMYLARLVFMNEVVAGAKFVKK